LIGVTSGNTYRIDRGKEKALLKETTSNSFIRMPCRSVLSHSVQEQCIPLISVLNKGNSFLLPIPCAPLPLTFKESIMRVFYFFKTSLRESKNNVISFSANMTELNDI